jgi:hypothetical protein
MLQCHKGLEQHFNKARCSCILETTKLQDIFNLLN